MPRTRVERLWLMIFIYSFLQDLSEHIFLVMLSLCLSFLSLKLLSWILHEADKLHFTSKTIEVSGRVDIYIMFFATGKTFSETTWRFFSSPIKEGNLDTTQIILSWDAWSHNYSRSLVLYCSSRFSASLPSPRCLIPLGSREKVLQLDRDLSSPVEPSWAEDSTAQKRLLVLPQIYFCLFFQLGLYVSWLLAPSALCWFLLLLTFWGQSASGHGRARLPPTPPPAHNPVVCVTFPLGCLIDIADSARRD